MKQKYDITDRTRPHGKLLKKTRDKYRRTLVADKPESSKT
jgi:ribosomal protein S8E